MFGVELAVVGITCLVMVVLLLTSPWWMRALTAIVRAVWGQISSTDNDVVVRTAPKDVVDGEFREVDK